MNYKVLIIDDELEIAESTAEYFNMFDVKTVYKTEYQAGIEFLRKNQVSLLLLDINLGNKSGFEFCKEVRKESNIPILFISARNSDDDILTALNIGGDDYIKKPYTLNILLAKVKSVLKRYEENESHSSCGVIKIDDTISMDYNYHQVIVSAQPIKLKEMEFQLLKYLVENKNRVVHKEELFEKVWSDNYVGDGTLAVHIRHLREKIEENPNEPNFIKTAWGIGYVFEA